MASTTTSTNSAISTTLAVAAGMGLGILVSKKFLSTSTRMVEKTSRPYKPGQTPNLPDESFGKKIHILNPATLTSAYGLMISSVAPRPIALISSTNKETGVDNVAPYSYFNVVGHNPPMIAIGGCRNRDASMKDSIANIVQSNEFVVNIISEWYLEAANHTCGNFAAETDEFVESGLTKSHTCEVVQIPRVKEAAIALECKVVHIQNVGKPSGPDGSQDLSQPSGEIVLAQVMRVHVDEYVLNKTGETPSPEELLKPVVDTKKLDPIGRLGGNVFTTLGDLYDIPRPQV